MLLPVSMQAQKNTAFIPGQVWNDMDGNPINAHGGGLLYHNGTYYWYGEYKKGKTILPDWATWECYRTDVTGVGCYSSKDLDRKSTRLNSSHSDRSRMPASA